MIKTNDSKILLNGLWIKYLSFALSFIDLLLEVFPLHFLLFVEFSLHPFVFAFKILDFFIESLLILQHVIEFLFIQVLVAPLPMRVQKHFVIHVRKFFLKFTKFILKHFHFSVVVFVQVLYLYLVFLLNCVQHLPYR